MSDYNNSPNMSMPVPIPSVTSGPAWASYEVTCFGILDGHTHQSGSGVPITPAAITINAPLAFNNNSLTTISTAGFTNQLSQPSATTVPNALYSFDSNGDLYYNDGNNNQIQLTKNGSPNSGGGSISGLSSPASASFATTTFFWEATGSTPANMDFGNAIFRNASSLTYGVTMTAPTLGSNYTLTLPALPAANNTFLTINTTGNINSNIVVDNSTTEISSTLLQVKNAGITTAKIADQSVTAAKILNGTITQGQISNTANIQGSQLVSSPDFAGTPTIYGGFPLVASLSNYPSPVALMAGTATTGSSGSGAYGYAYTSAGTGACVVTLYGGFGTIYSVVATINSGGGLASFPLCYVSITANNQFYIYTSTSGGNTPANFNVAFIAYGEL